MSRVRCHVSRVRPPSLCQPLSLEVSRGQFARRGIGHDPLIAVTSKKRGLEAAVLVLARGRAGTGDRETPHSIE